MKPAPLFSPKGHHCCRQLVLFGGWHLIDVARCWQGKNSMTTTTGLILVNSGSEVQAPHLRLKNHWPIILLRFSWSCAWRCDFYVGVHFWNVFFVGQNHLCRCTFLESVHTRTIFFPESLSRTPLILFDRELSDFWPWSAGAGVVRPRKVVRVFWARLWNTNLTVIEVIHGTST